MVSEKFCLHLHANAARFFWSLFREYENLKEARKVSSEMTEKLKKELFAANSKLQRTVSDLENTKEELESTQKDLKNADKEILVRILFFSLQ